MATKRNVGRTQGTAPNGSSHLYDDVLSLAGTLLRDRKEIGGRRLMELSESVRDMAQTLPEMPNLASYVGTTADSLTDLADYISGSELETIVGDANQFARRHPMMTMGIAAAAGLAAMTYFRSGPARRTKDGVKRAPGRRTGATRKSISAGEGRKSVNGVGRAAHA
jgi:ElaB/YqjD/DUF883 family membrane-anchored ribosome-binding protein